MEIRKIAQTYCQNRQKIYGFEYARFLLSLFRRNYGSEQSKNMKDAKLLAEDLAQSKF